MSSQRVCPNCHKEMETPFEFGMTSCVHCGHLFIADDAAPAAAAEPALQSVSASPAPTIDNQQVRLNDIADFGNLQTENLSAGGLYYNIEISGLDTPELKSELADVLEDKKLGISPQSVLSKITNGVVVLMEIHPVKAFVLVTRLKPTSLKIRWSTGQLIKKMVVLFLLTVATIFALGDGQAWASDWAKHEINLKQYAIKINNLQDEIMGLAQKKNQEPDPKKKEEMLEEIKKKYTELKTTHKDLLDEMEHVRFEHPEKGDKTIQQYKHVKLKSLEEIETDTSVDGQMLRLKRKAEQQYGTPPPPKEN